MFLVGLTGGIASGKSSVLQIFQQLGCAVVDVDVIARHGESRSWPWRRGAVWSLLGSAILFAHLTLPPSLFHHKRELCKPLFPAAFLPLSLLHPRAHLRFLSLHLWTLGPVAPGLTPPPLPSIVIQPGYPAHQRIVEAFGTEVLLENGDINRKVLGDLIFKQPDQRQLLNAITHPEIRKEMIKETFKYFLQGENRACVRGVSGKALGL